MSWSSAALQRTLSANIAIAKFTHSGTQIIDWTPEGSMAKTRNIYPRFIDFVRESMQELVNKGHEVIAYVADVGQQEDLERVREKALATGASKVRVEDLKEEFVTDFVL